MGSDYRINYAKYMASAKWLARKDAFFRKHGRRCKACKATKLIELHHRSYANFTNEKDADLVALCEGCHALVHYLQRKNGLSLIDATDLVLRPPKKRSIVRSKREATRHKGEPTSLDNLFAKRTAQQRVARKREPPLSRADRIQHQRAMTRKWEQQIKAAGG